MPVPTLCKPLDELLGGGFDDDTLSEVYGEGGVGKTNLCLQMARNVARMGKKVVMIDTEGVSLERLRQMCEEQGDFEDVLSKILLYSPFDLLQQEEMIRKSVKLARGKTNVGLVVVDSATAYYRLELGACNDVDEKQILAQGAQELLRLSRQENIPCIITSQVYSKGDNGEVRPIGGHALWHTSKTIIKLEKVGMGWRRATLMKHRHMPEERTCEFRLTGAGVVGE
ncbi:MAG: DNA repair and recombination protein RadB [Candidatus Thermoplasmatota archaeon]|nr:DNA repair and recombination protein RadB [Candidatus Thermoplasmatota archaeon]